MIIETKEYEVRFNDLIASYQNYKDEMDNVIEEVSNFIESLKTMDIEDIDLLINDIESLGAPYLPSTATDMDNILNDIEEELLDKQK